MASIKGFPANRVVPGLIARIKDILTFFMPTMPQHVEDLGPGNLSLRSSLCCVDGIKEPTRVERLAHTLQQAVDFWRRFYVCN